MPAKKKQIIQEVEKLSGLCKDTCTFLWENPEVGGTEQKSSAYMRDLMIQEGFQLSGEKWERLLVKELPLMMYS